MGKIIGPGEEIPTGPITERYGGEPWGTNRHNGGETSLGVTPASQDSGPPGIYPQPGDPPQAFGTQPRPGPRPATDCVTG